MIRTRLRITAALIAASVMTSGRRAKSRPQWSVDQLSGAVDAKVVYSAAKTGSTAGFIKATVNGLTGTARVRVIEPMPWPCARCDDRQGALDVHYARAD
jgi:hypothetical protein